MRVAQAVPRVVLALPQQLTDSSGALQSLTSPRPSCLFAHWSPAMDVLHQEIVLMVNRASTEISQKTWNRDTNTSEFWSWLCPLISRKLHEVQSEGAECPLGC